MNQIRTRVVVGADHRISGTVPAEVPAGEHEFTRSFIEILWYFKGESAEQPKDMKKRDA